MIEEKYIGGGGGGGGGQASLIKYFILWVYQWVI